MMIGTVATTADVATALSALNSDPYVASAYSAGPVQMSSATLTSFEVTTSPGAPVQYGREEFNTDAAWSLAGGYALVSILDNGLDPTHPFLWQFDNTPQHNYKGGNFLSTLSKNISLTGSTPPTGWDPTNVDEAEPLIPPSSTCTSQIPTTVGHGTHVSGLLAAIDANNGPVEGICKHCGIAMWKIGQEICVTNVTPPDVEYFPNPNAPWRGFAQATDVGSQIISASFGFATLS